MTKFVNVGHRGAAAYAHENTVGSMRAAIVRHADMLEFDVRQTLDGILVLYHNWSVKTKTGRRKAVSKVTFSEISEIAQGRGFELATFAEILNIFGPLIPLNIEIKAGGYESEVVQMVHKFKPAFRPTLSSFFPWVIRRIKYCDSNSRTALILGRERIVRLNVLAGPVIDRLVPSLGISAIHLQEAIASQALVDRLSDLGVAVFVWTVDDPARIRKLLRIGVNGIITNCPDVLYKTCLEMVHDREPILKQISGPIGKFAYAI